MQRFFQILAGCFNDNNGDELKLTPVSFVLLGRSSLIVTTMDFITEDLIRFYCNRDRMDVLICNPKSVMISLYNLHYMIVIAARLIICMQAYYLFAGSTGWRS